MKLRNKFRYCYICNYSEQRNCIKHIIIHNHDSYCNKNKIYFFNEYIGTLIFLEKNQFVISFELLKYMNNIILFMLC